MRHKAWFYTGTSGGGGGGSGPSVLSLDGWYQASYSGSPWSPTASAGTSGTNGTLVTSSVAPSTGTAVNSLTPATFNGSTQALVSGTAAMSALASVGAMTLLVLMKASATTAAASDFYDDPLLAGDSGGNCGLVYTSSGVRAGVFQASSKQTTSIALATGTWALCVMRYDGTNVKCRVSTSSGTTDATPVASGNPVFGTSLYVGRNYANAKHYAGDILEVITSATALSDANLVTIRDYYNTRYSLALA